MSSPATSAPAAAPVTAAPAAPAYPVPIAYPWMPDAGDGTYRNPILCADYSDPDVVRDGEDYWLTASSFNCTPGLPILHSRDLVNGTIVNHAIRNNPDPRKVYDSPQHGCGVWAPAIRKHAGKFWIFFPLPDEGIYVTTADDPRGEWCEPWCVLEGKGLIDPCPLWDEDGRAYLAHAYANSRAGIKHVLRVRPMSPDGRRVLGEGEVVWNEPERHPTCEGPKFHKRDGWYYISAPAGGVPTGWQVILRSRQIYGPYEEKIVLAQGKTAINGPHQGAIVDALDGSWWFVHFQDMGLYGRVCHLQPVRWEDGWPLMGVNQDASGCGEPVMTYRKPVQGMPTAAPQTSDEFDGKTLGLQWQWHSNHRPEWWSLGERPSHLRLKAVPTPSNLKEVGSLLMQKLPARSFTVRTELHLKGEDPQAQAGLIIAGHRHAALIVSNGASGRSISVVTDGELRESHPISRCGGLLELTLAEGGDVTLAFTENGSTARREFAVEFKASVGHWIGAKVGLFCRTLGQGPTDAYADFDYLRFS